MLGLKASSRYIWVNKYLLDAFLDIQLQIKSSLNSLLVLQNEGIYRPIPSGQSLEENKNKIEEIS
jgi:hypothetical protein